MGIFDDALRVLDQFGLSEVLIPFMLVFTLVYAILLKIKIFGDGPQANKYYAIIALALALGVIIPHNTRLYPVGSDPVVIINSSLPAVAGIIIALIMVLILIGAFGWKFVGGEWFRNLFALGSFGIILYIFGSSAGWLPYGWSGVLDTYFPPEVQSLVVILFVFGLIIMFITGGGPTVDVWGSIKKGLEEFKVEKK